MSKDFRVKGRTNREVQAIANKLKRYFGVNASRPVNIIRCLQSGVIETEQGKKRLIFKTLPDEQMGDDDGRTEFQPGVVIISIKESVYKNANWGDGRSRMTLAHELAHAVMHEGATKFRATGAQGTIDLVRVNAFESAEHQAKVFAAAFLIHDEMATELETADAISEEFVVSLEAAKIAFERLTRQVERAKSVERIQRLSDQFRADACEKKQELHYSDEPCTTCGEKKLIPIGIKFLCQSCNSIGDQFQDGDRHGS
ncbi:ImmA/IrrE family metallo-endopeptidase [Microvirga sp. 3-52]|uniref:ImmA/IrrE family metallo-endopeptidase n=1 Tax=Microvirga sp. 3-52 TaxID=2792425 RepID=UPI001ACE557C|nr:ImmA/IrrE family metallo-endopeptidase [Microvirga sp. 3-52]MBO1905343.1 ImmA/IrrE family metallo-endopeptidase [Microvirga sp. 3-52]MBS7452568.1 ImmA/IrrE family metallo-endopeptidase [Microvirga sp. 3-52]